MYAWVISRVYKKGKESVVLRISPYNRALESAKVNVVGASRTYAIVWYLYTANVCSHIVCPHVHHGQACACTQNSESTRVIAVTTLDVCGTLLRNLTLALSKARLYVAIRSTTLSFPSYILLVILSSRNFILAITSKV